MGTSCCKRSTNDEDVLQVKPAEEEEKSKLILRSNPKM